MAGADGKLTGRPNGDQAVQHRQQVGPPGQFRRQPGQGGLQEEGKFLPVLLLQGEEEGQAVPGRGPGEDQVGSGLPRLVGLPGLFSWSPEGFAPGPDGGQQKPRLGGEKEEAGVGGPLLDEL